MLETLQARITERLDALEKSAVAASQEAGLGRTAVSDILSGKSRSPQFDTIIRLARVLKCSPAYLVGAYEAPFPPDGGIRDAVADFEMVQIAGELQVGVLKDEKIEAERTIEYGIYDHPNYLDYSLKLYRMGDDNFAKRSILRGDHLTVAAPRRAGAIELDDMMLVVANRFLSAGGRNYVELALWEVTRTMRGEDGPWMLYQRPSARDAPVQRIALRGRLEDQKEPNSYTASDGSRVEILGVVCRVIRNLPTY